MSRRLAAAQPSHCQEALVLTPNAAIAGADTRDQLLSLQSSSPGRVGPRPAAPASMSDFASSEGQVLTTEAPVYGGLTTSVEGSGIGLRNNFTTPVDSPRLAAVGEESQFEIEF